MSSQEQIEHLVYEIETILKNDPSITDKDKLRLLAKVQVTPKYLLFNTYYTERLLKKKSLEVLKQYKVAAVHGNIIDMDAEDIPSFEETSGSVVFHASEYSRSQLQDVLQDLDYCEGWSAGFEEKDGFYNGKYVKEYIYDCESG